MLALLRWYQRTAFGLQTAHSGEETKFTFVGKQGYFHHQELELYFLALGGNSASSPGVYDPATGQFIRKDPLGPDADAQGNVYRYVGNNPVNRIDPSGLQPGTTATTIGTHSPVEKESSFPDAELFEDYLKAQEAERQRLEDYENELAVEEIAQKVEQALKDLYETQEQIANKEIERNRIETENILYEADCKERAALPVQLQAKNMNLPPISVDAATALNAVHQHNQTNPWEEKTPLGIEDVAIRLPGMGYYYRTYAMNGFVFTMYETGKIEVLVNARKDPTLQDRLFDTVGPEKASRYTRYLYDGLRAPKKEEWKQINQLMGSPMQPTWARDLANKHPNLADDLQILLAAATFISGNEGAVNEAYQMRMDGATSLEITAHVAKAEMSFAAMMLILGTLGTKLIGAAKHTIADWLSKRGRKLLNDAPEKTQREFMKELEKLQDLAPADQDKAAKELIERFEKKALRGQGAPLILKGREGKLTQHAHDWGIGTKGKAPAGAAEKVATIAKDIHNGATQLRQGRWHEVPDALFYFKDNHIVVTKPDGMFITILKNAQNNKWFNQAGIAW